MIISEISKQKFRFFLDENIISEILKIIRKDGAAGLWEYLKDQFADLKTTVMDAIMDIVQTQVIPQLPHESFRVAFLFQKVFIFMKT